MSDVIDEVVRKAKKAAYMREYRARNPERILKIERAAYERHKEVKNRKKRERLVSDPEYAEKKRRSERLSRQTPEGRAENRRRVREWRLKYPERAKETRLQSAYGISSDQLGTMLALQDGRCAICRTPADDLKKGLAIDHNHETGQVRGLLCNNCNTALGLLKDSPELMGRAAAYVEKWS